MRSEATVQGPEVRCQSSEEKDLERPVGLGKPVVIERPVGLERRVSLERPGGREETREEVRGVREASGSGGKKGLSRDFVLKAVVTEQMFRCYRSEA